MSLLQQPQVQGIGPTTLGNPFSQFMAPTAPEPVVPNITPRKSPVDLTSQGTTMDTSPVTQPKLPQGIPEPKLQATYANNPFEDKMNGVTRDQYGQKQSEPGTLGAFDPNELIKGIGDTGTSIKNTMNDVGDFFQNKAPGLEKAKQENRFLTQDHLTTKISSAIQAMPDATDEEIAHAIGQLKNEGYFFEGMNDKNFDNPVTNFLGNTTLGTASDLIGGVAKMGGNFVGGTLEGGAQMSQGMVDAMGGDTKGYADVVQGATNYGLNILNGAIPGASSILNTESVKPVIENTLQPLQEGIQKNIVNKGLDLTGMDPNSEEYKKYSDALSTVGTILATMGIAKLGEVGYKKTFGEDLNYNNTKVGDFVKNTGKTADDLASAIKQAKPDFKGNIKDSTPISKVFTPEEYAHIEAMARQNGATGVGRREGLISDATQAKVKEKVTSGIDMAKKRSEQPAPISDMGDNNAINSQGIKGTVPEPTIITNIKDKVFGDSNDIDLANRAVSPRNVKGKTMSDKMKSGEVALAGIQQLHDDSIAGNITTDIGTIEGGIAGIEEARQHYGKIIGENANPDEKIGATDIGQTLKEELQNPIMVISGPIKGIGDDLVQMLDHPSFQDGITMKDVQTTLSTISNRIRNSPELRNSLQSEPAGQAVSAFIDELARRYEKAVEEGGNGVADKQARQAYAKYMKIQNDLLNSGMVNARNTRSGQAGFVGKSIATYELLTNGVSGIPVALAMKYLGETKGEYATRGGAYQKLIRNMDRKALQRTEGKYNNGDTSKYTPKPTPKSPKPTPKTKKDAGNSVNNSSVPTDTVDMAGTEGKPTPRSEIPGAKRTKIEVPGNPKGNISNRLAGNKGVIVPKNPNMIEDTSKVLPSGDRMRKAEVAQVEKDLNTALQSKYNPDKPKATKTFIDSAIQQGKITKEEGTAMVEKLYENANGFDKPHYEKLLNDLYSNKSESWDDLLNEKKENKPTISPRKEYMDSPKGMFEQINKIGNDKRYGTDKADALIADFKKKTGWDLMKDGGPVFDKDGQIVKGKKEKYRTADDMNNTQLTTKILKGLGDRETVSKEFIRNMTNSGDVKQIEKDIIRGLLESEGDKVNVVDFKKKVQAELLPLGVSNPETRKIKYNSVKKEFDIVDQEIIDFYRKNPRSEDATANDRMQKELSKLYEKKDSLYSQIRKYDPMTKGNKYEFVSLKGEEKGRVKNYKENIYESPIETSVGGIHFSGQTDNYFGHTRIEDMENGTRRVIEVQSDLFQKGRLEKEITSKTAESSSNNLGGYEDIQTMEKMIEDDKKMIDYGEKNGINTDSFNEQLKSHQEKLDGMNKKLKNSGVAKLSQYNDPTAHFRMIREEVSQAVKDGVKTMQFPTGETAMKIEGLGESAEWFSDVEKPNGFLEKLTPENVKKGMTITDQNGEPHIVLWNFGDGTFRVIMKDLLDQFIKDQRYEGISLSEKEAIDKFQEIGFTGEFVDLNLGKEKYSSNPIYKFYEKEVGRYLKNKYDAKLVTDDKGVSWYQVDVKDSMGGPVEAFRTDITPKITPKMTPEQKIELQELNKKFFGDDSIQIVDKIDSNSEALGSYKGGMIKIVEGQGKPLDTLHHEAVHKYLDVFATEKEAKAILEYGKEKYKDSDYASVEEKIAEDFIKYAKDRSGFTGSIRKLFDSIIGRIKQFFGNGDKIQKMYRDIMGGKAKKVDLGIKPKEEKFRTDITPKPVIKPKKEYASALEAMNSPEYKARMEKINENKPKKVTKTSNNLYHTTKAENIESIMKEGLVVGKKARYEGVSSPSKISFSANEKGASYYGGPDDIMIRTKTSYKPDDLDIDYLAGGEGTYTTGKNIPPEMLQVKVKGKWIDLVDYGRIEPKTDITPKITPKEDKNTYYRLADEKNRNTDATRGGTWYGNKEGMGIVEDHIKEGNTSIGGKNTYKEKINPKNPLIVEGAVLEEGSVGVINNGYEKLIPKKYADIAKKLYESIDNNPNNPDSVIMDALYDAGISEKQALSVMNESSKNKLDTAFDLIIGKGSKEAGYDAIILKDGKSEHIFYIGGNKKTDITPKIKPRK